ncbi:MAG TPA: SDR family NAD(P)-dependent oxidoreductase, partial [Ardenticatenaceae bacterium]|nr:SDR family NAD(P)-dependent oxidoreductase [Ardenticatenaceae bacterium]
MSQSDQEQIQPPGTEAEMTPQADHGENSYKGSGKLTGRVAVITGGDSGIGRAVAVLYAREGADVAIVYLEVEESDAQETKRAVEAEGRR